MPKKNVQVLWFSCLQLKNFKKIRNNFVGSTGSTFDNSTYILATIDRTLRYWYLL